VTYPASSVQSCSRSWSAGKRDYFFRYDVTSGARGGVLSYGEFLCDRMTSINREQTTQRRGNDERMQWEKQKEIANNGEGKRKGSYSIVSWFLFDCLHGSCTYTELSGHWRLFVLVSCARLSWSHSAFESTLNSSIVSYRTAEKNVENQRALDVDDIEYSEGKKAKLMIKIMLLCMFVKIQIAKKLCSIARHLRKCEKHFSHTSSSIYISPKPKWIIGPFYTMSSNTFHQRKCSL